MEDINSFSWVLRQLDDILFDELTKSCLDLINHLKGQSIYGIVIVDGSSLQLRYQTREHLSELLTKRANDCALDVESLAPIYRWQVDSFRVFSDANLNKSSKIIDKLSSRLTDLVHSSLSNAKQFSQAHELENEVLDKIEEIFIRHLNTISQNNFQHLSGDNQWPVGVSYVRYRQEEASVMEKMEVISGKATVDFYHALGPRRLSALLDHSIQTRLNEKLSAFSESIYKETSTAFENTIQAHGDERIYWMCLYHNGDCTSYITTSFATEKGLDQVAKQYQRHSQLSFEQQRKSLRWSPCDSPYHDDGDDLSESEALLNDLSELIDEAQRSLALNLNVDEFDDITLELHREISEQIHQVLIAQLARVKNVETIREYIEKNACTLWVTAGDTHHDPVKDIALIHDLAESERIMKEMNAAAKIYELESILNEEKLEQEKEKPTTPSFELSDFEELANCFNPTFEEREGCIFSSDLGDNIHNSFDSAAESGHNQYDLMSLLKNSKHFDEIDKLYGHFIGVEFEQDDFLPSIARIFVKKLAANLQNAYPERSFVIYLEVSRNSRSRFQFYQNRQDGFTSGFKSATAQTGISEYFLVGQKPISVKIPVGICKDKGHYLARAFGFYPNELHTEKSLVDHAFVSMGKDADEACKLLQQMLLEHFNKAYNQSYLDFESILYPSTALPEPSQGLHIDDSNEELYEDVEFWRILELKPDFLTDKIML